MKTLFFVISLFSLLMLTESCKDGPMAKRATGLPYEVVVVMNQPAWQSEIGEAVKADLLSAIPGLPQSEPTMRVTYVQPKDFNGLLTYVRNIFILNIDPAIYTKASLKSENDHWSQGQRVLTLNAPDTASALEYFSQNPRQLADIFTKIEMERTAALLQKDYSVIVLEHLKKKFDIELYAPSNMSYFRDTTGFFWASNNAGTGRTDLIAYTFPYTDPNTFTLDYLVAKRDSVLKENLPGSFPNSYMTTETRFPSVTYIPITVKGKYCGVLRGLWRMQGDMMGGPFVSHVRLDEQNNRVVVVEGFVFAPETDKRNFIRRIEAALYTLRLPGEFKEPVEQSKEKE